MKWFSVKYVFQIVSGSGNHTPQFDEQVRLLFSKNIADALTKAENVARQFQQAFKNIKNEQVSWEFIGITDLHEIQPPADGCEVSSVIHEPEDRNAFIDQAKKYKEYLNDVIETVPVN